MLITNSVTIKIYIFIIAIVIISAWLFFEKQNPQKIEITTNQVNSILESDVIDESKTDEQIVADDTKAELLNNLVTMDVATRDGVNPEYGVENTDSVSDDVWFSELMKKAHPVQDRIINIDITGAGYKDIVNITDDHQNRNISDDESLLPQPTEAETLAENKVDCSSAQYMGGNEYGRNMLAAMGCPTVP